MDVSPLSVHLTKLPSSLSDEVLSVAVETLWSTRKTGLSSDQKENLQSLLGLSTPSELHPVLACLRLIIRKCVQEEIADDHIQKLFPFDLSTELRSSLTAVLLKYLVKWKEEAPDNKSIVSYQINGERQPRPSKSPELSILWPREDSTNCSANGSTFSNSVTSCVDSNRTAMHMGNAFLDDLATLPCLKTLSWTVENRNPTPANRNATITLKLQDNTEPPSEEKEVKFQLTKDTLEAMLRSMACINEQFNDSVTLPSEPVSEQQRE